MAHIGLLLSLPLAGAVLFPRNSLIERARRRHGLAVHALALASSLDRNGETRTVRGLLIGAALTLLVSLGLLAYLDHVL